MKKYEIALLFGSYEYKDVVTYEFDTMKDLQAELRNIIEDIDENLYKIELSIQDQDESGENQNTYTFADINIQEFLKGETKATNKKICSRCGKELFGDLYRLTESDVFNGQRSYYWCKDCYDNFMKEIGITENEK